MPLKKSELYSSLWKSCDELRGGMDASQYKDYVLVLLFVKYVSDKYAHDPNALIDVPVGGSFFDMVLAKGSKEIGDRINKIIGRLADANDSLKGAINVADFNDEEKLGKGQAMVDRLTKLVGLFEGLDFGANRAEGDDLLGDAYEYLMRHFATESGKSKGQFYTPAEVSRVMSQVIGLAQAKNAGQSIYDPTCGSGSLLLKAHDEALSHTGLDLALYGQEMDNATSALARMNMVLHDCPTAEIWQDNTLSHPHFTQGDGSLKTFDFIVANPPFSFKSWSTGFDPAHDLYGRFAYGQPPAKNGDYAFLLHILASLKPTGKAAVILPHGVLFRGGAEGAIRQRLIEQGVIQAIIGLPANLFYGTGIPACIIVLDKEGAAGRKAIFLMDASRGYLKDGNKNRLRERDIHRIVSTFTARQDVERYARLVPLADIAANGYNLNLPRYIDSTEAEDPHDLTAHLAGGIPNRDIEDRARSDGLGHYWQAFPTLRSALFAEHSRLGYSRLQVDAAQIKPAIYAHPEFAAFQQRVQAHFAAWCAAVTPRLQAIAVGERPKLLIAQLSSGLLAHLRQDAALAALIDPYALYQHLLDYWADTMQDDVWQLAAQGWQARSAEGINHTDLIPPALLIARYYRAEQAKIDALQTQREAQASELQALEEEHGGEDGLLSEARNDKGKLTAKSVKDRLKAIKGDKDAQDEAAQLAAYVALLDKEAAHAKAVRSAQAALDALVAQRYAQLSQEEVQTLVVQDKWLATLTAQVRAELERVSQTLTQRVRELAERYATPLPQLEKEVQELAARVQGHLQRMGVVW